MNPLTKEQLRERITSEIWEALNMAGADPETVASKDAIYFKTDNLLNLILQDRKVWGEYVIGEDNIKKPNSDDYNDWTVCDTCDVILDDLTEPAMACICDRRNELRAEQRQRNQKENKDV